MFKKGFTLIEVIIAIFILIVGVVAVFMLVNKGLSGTIDLSDKLVAAYLAQEGIEIVRNMRDTNWVQYPPPPGGYDWDAGLSSGDWQADYDDPVLAIYNSAAFLNFDGNFYNYDPVTATNIKTKFRRKITTDLVYDGVAANYLLVTVTVEWLWKGSTLNMKSFIAADRLYEWYAP